jgi:hypothetical protein
MSQIWLSAMMIDVQFLVVFRGRRGPLLGRELFGCGGLEFRGASSRRPQDRQSSAHGTMVLNAKTEAAFRIACEMLTTEGGRILHFPSPPLS